MRSGTLTRERTRDTPSGRAVASARVGWCRSSTGICSRSPTRWNCSTRRTPAERFALRSHHQPLVIHRHQVTKQADIVLAMFLLSHEFSEAQKRANFDYYDPLTTGDS
jgi:hypothetical protein